MLCVPVPVREQHVPGELLSLYEQILNGSLGLSRLSLQSRSGIRQLLRHDPEDQKS